MEKRWIRDLMNGLAELENLGFRCLDKDPTDQTFALDPLQALTVIGPDGSLFDFNVIALSYLGMER
jgi:hypothetical protein